MSLESAVTQLEQTNATLVQEVTRFRDAAMGLNAIYPTITAGRQAVDDGQYYSVPGEGAYMRLYRRQGSSAELIATFPSLESLVAALNDATAEAESRAATEADRARDEAIRAEVYADNKGHVTRERFKKSATLGLDFEHGIYRRDNGTVIETNDPAEAVTLTRSTPKWVEALDGSVVEVPADTLAREWREWVKRGSSTEQARTNLTLWSEDLLNAEWSPSRCDVTQATLLDPRGAPFFLLVPTTESATHFLTESASLPADSNVAMSVSAHADGYRFLRIQSSQSNGFLETAQVSFDLHAGTYEVLNGSPDVVMEKKVRGSYRCGIVNRTNGTAGNKTWIMQCLDEEGNSTFSGDGTAGIYLNGVQTEVGDSVSSPIPTEDAPVTRAADSLSASLLGVYNPELGTYLVDFYMDHVVPNEGVVDIVNGWKIRTAEVEGGVRFRLMTPDTVGTTVTGTLPLPGRFKIAVSWDREVARISINGGAAVEVISETAPSENTQVRLMGRDNLNEQGSICSFVYAPTYISSAELSELTTD